MNEKLYTKFKNRLNYLFSLLKFERQIKKWLYLIAIRLNYKIT